MNHTQPNYECIGFVWGGVSANMETRDTMIKAIDFYLEHLKSNNEPNSESTENEIKRVQDVKKWIENFWHVSF